MKSLTNEQIKEEAVAFFKGDWTDVEKLAAFGCLCRDGRPETFEEALGFAWSKADAPNHRGYFTLGANFGRDWEREHGRRALPTKGEITQFINRRTANETYGATADYASGVRDSLAWLAVRDSLAWLAARDKAQKGTA